MTEYIQGYINIYIYLFHPEKKIYGCQMAAISLVSFSPSCDFPSVKEPIYMCHFAGWDKRSGGILVFFFTVFTELACSVLKSQ